MPGRGLQIARRVVKAIVPSSHVTVFDESDDPVALARKRAADAGIDNVTFVCARAQELEYERGVLRFR
jgi:ubiquinone/menaquinone biosynthesis C-methylase UbiE